jgi:hypothetical protein
MKFHRIDQQGSVADTHAYLAYLRANRERLPDGVRAFALSDWFHDRQNSRCLHDAWLESLTIKDFPASGNQDARSVEISVRLHGAYRDGFIEMTYQNVTNYLMTAGTPVDKSMMNSHGDMMIDEISIEPECLLHEAAFSSGAKWAICCSDIRYLWIPA